MPRKTTYIISGLFLPIILASRVMGAADLDLSLTLFKDEVFVGEPLVVFATIKNQGENKIITPFYKSEAFRKHAGIVFTIHGGSEVLGKVGGSEARVMAILPDQRYWGIPGMPDYSIAAGSSVIAKRVVSLMKKNEKASQTFFLPGDYSIKASVDFRVWQDGGLKWVKLESKEIKFKIKTPDAKFQECVATLARIPNLESFLSGQWGTPTKSMTEALDSLNKNFPESPFRVYLDFATLAQDSEKEEFLNRAEKYLSQFPDGPFVDDVLFRLASIEYGKRNAKKSIGYCERLLKQHPQSPLADEAKDTIRKIRSGKR